MVIDADVHISPFDLGNSISADELLRRMDRSNIEKSLTWLQPSYFPDITAGNRYVFQATRDHPDRILGFGWTDPHYGISQAIEEAKRCVEEYGFYGVKFNGAQNYYYIDSEDLALPVIDVVAQMKTILAFHIGADAFDATHPYRLAKIARRHPETPILMVHMGGVGFHDITHAAIEVGQEHPNITLIGSAVRAIKILSAIKTLGADRVCFGSDTPFALMHVELAMYKALMEDELTPGKQSKVMGGNIARLFKLGIN